MSIPTHGLLSKMTFRGEEWYNKISLSTSWPTIMHLIFSFGIVYSSLSCFMFMEAAEMAKSDIRSV
jgi:hypothetical protein